MRPGNARFIVLLAVGSVAFISAHIAAGQSAPSLSLQAAGTAAQVNVTGDIGSPCIIQVTTNLLSANDWQTVGSVTLLSGSSTVVDGVSGGFGGRFYRGLIPAPSNGVWIPAGTFTMGSPT